MSKKNTIIIAIAIATLTVMSISYGFISVIKKRLTDNLINQYSRQELLIAETSAKILEREISTIQEKLNLIAQIPEVKSGNTEDCNRKVKEVFSAMSDKVGNLGRMDARGIFSCSVTDGAIGIDGTRYPHLKKIIDEHVAVLGRNLISQTNPRPVTSLHVPIFDNNEKFVGTLGGAIYFDDIANKYLKDVVFAKQGYVTLVDDNGDILYHPQKDFIGKNLWSEEMQKITGGNKDLNDMIKEAVAGKSAVKRYLFGGKEKLAANVPANIFPGRRWVVSVSMPIEDVHEALFGVGVDKLFQMLSLMMGGIVILVFSGLLVYMVKTVFNPINAMAKSMNKISRGDLSGKVNLEESKDEIGSLVKSFNRLVASVKILMEDESR